MTETNQANHETEDFEEIPVSKIETSGDSLEQVIEIACQEADNAVDKLLTQGTDMAERIAVGMGEVPDNQVKTELTALQTEATQAHSELEQSIKSVEITPEQRVFAELRRVGEEFSACLAEAGLLQPDGSFIDNAQGVFELLPQEKQQKFLDFNESIETLAKSLGAEIFSSDALTTLPAEMRENIVDEVVTKIAQDNPEGYLSAYVSAQEHGLVPVFKSDEEREKKRKEGVQKFVSHQNAVINGQLADPLEAARSFSVVRKKAYDLGLFDIKATSRLEEAVKDGLNQIEQAGGDSIAYFRELPDGTPGLNFVALKMIDNKHPSFGDREYTKSAIFQSFGEKAPDAILALANAENHFEVDAWTEEEMKYLIQQVARLPDAKQAILAETHLPNDADQTTLDVFQAAYEKYSPGKLIAYADRFPKVLFDEQLADRALETDSVNEVAQKINIFHGLTRGFAERLIKRGRGRDVLKQPEKFSGLAFDANLAVFLFETNPILFTENLNSFTSEQILEAADSLKVSLTQRLGIIKITPGLSENAAWGSSLLALEKIQARSANAEHDPWITDLDPLTRSAIDQGVLSSQSREDGELLVSFVQEFGAVNALLMFKAFVLLKRVKSVNELPEPIQNELRLVLGEKKFEKMRTPEAVINALRNYRREVTNALLRDEVPVGIESGIGKEILGLLKGTTSWERGHDSTALLNTWKETVETNPDVAKIPEGYHEVAISVRSRKHSEAGLDPSVDQQRNEVINNTDTQARFRAFQEGFRTGSGSLENIVADAREQLSGILRWQIIKTTERMTTLPEKAQIGIKKNIEALNQQLEQVEEFGFKIPSGEKSPDAQIVALLKEVVGWNDKDINSDSLLRALSVAHMRETAPQQFVEVILKLGQSGQIATANELTLSRTFIVDYLNEHYLHPDKQHQTGHEVFSSNVLKALRRAWQIASGAEDHPLVRAGNELHQLNKGIITEETVDISLVPAQGPLRIFSGDIGDACYTSKHEQLAKGEVPDLHSMVFVTARGTANERFAGSVLFIETESDTGESTLMVRANNPRENLLQSVDADDLISKTLGEAIAVAKRRGIARVVVPGDSASSSSSNRPDVASYYQKNFAEAPKVGLKDEPETNFNGYRNWDKNGKNAVVEVWVNQEPTQV